MKHIKILGLVLCLICSCIYAEPVGITLKDGTKWSGETDQFVTVEVEQKGKKKIFEGDLTRVTDSYIVVGGEFIFISDINSIKPENETTDLDPGDVNDDAVDSEEETDDKPEVVKPKSNEKDEEELQEIYVIPLIGKVGFIFGGDNPESSWFGEVQLEDMLKRAERAKAIEVILEIDSPGGDVNVRNAICDVIEEYRGKFVITAFPHDAFYEASTIALTCDKLIAAPDSRVGAGVVMNGGDPVDKKADASIVRTYLANAGRSGTISDAFSLVESELWYNESKNKFSSRKPEESSGWVEIDGPESVLTLNSQDLVDLKIASNQTRTLESLYKNFSIVSCAKRMNRAVGNATRAAKKLDETLDRFFGVEPQNELDFWLIELEKALRISPRDDDVWARIKKTEREVRKKVHRMKMEAEDVLDKNENGRYDFSISPQILGVLTIVQERGEIILGLDKMFENITLVRQHVDVILKTLQAIWF